MGYWSISAPIEGFIPTSFPTLRISNVVFHIFNDQYLDKPYLFGTVIVEGTYVNADDKGITLIDKALTRLQFVHRYPLFLIADDSRRIEIDNYEIDINNPKVGPQRVKSALEVWYSIGDQPIDDPIQKMNKISPQKMDTLDMALAFYRVAICSPNPFQAIETYFSCISSVVSDQVGHQPAKSELREALRPHVSGTPGTFKREFDDLYGRHRSASTHGSKMILDKGQILDAEKVSKKLNRWSRKIIDSFLQGNQV